jgi:hypothetical protein
MSAARAQTTELSSVLMSSLASAPNMAPTRFVALDRASAAEASPLCI